MSRMVRKQFYLEVQQDHKLKRLAAARGRTEAEVVREAVDQLPEWDEPPAIANLRAAGMIASKTHLPERLKNADRDALEGKWFEMLAKRKEPLTLSDAVLAERASSPY